MLVVTAAGVFLTEAGVEVVVALSEAGAARVGDGPLVFEADFDWSAACGTLLLGVLM